MGRRPNQLILEFFERGPKLEDASNRYQHTCKSCGEKVSLPLSGRLWEREKKVKAERRLTRAQFPKGRIDSLTNHLVKKCPALPLRDRQRALLQFHELPDLPDLSMSTSGPMQMQNGQTMNLPFAPSKQGLSALETLAEVSRQHLDLSGKRVPAQQRRSPPPQHQYNGGGLDEFLVDDRPELDSSALSQSMDMSNAPALPSIYQFNGPLHHSPTGSPHMSSMPLTSAGSMAQMVPSLVMAASAANELMPLTNGLTMEPELHLPNAGSMSDKFFHAQSRQWANTIDPLLPDHNNRELLPNEPDKSSSNQRPIAMNPHGTQTHFTTDFSVNQKPSKPKVRGRFTDTRRKEVQEVRKRGACIRCRMLKKPCSGDNPCNTCQNVESARLWKQPCIRTRIAEEFSLYSAGLYSVLAFHAVSQAKGQIHLDQIPGRIEVSHFPDSGIFATFTPLKCQPQTHGPEIDPAILASIPPSQLEIIDSADDISGKLDLYIKKIASSFFESEDSTFMKTTLNAAFGVTTTNQDGLLTKVLELWNLTRALTSPAVNWHIFSNPSLAPTMAPSTIVSSDLETINRTPITTASNHASYDLIKLQLIGATEKRAACLARIVMNDLERRLLQRQQASPFETFLVAVILLSCVERMCWLFHTWESDNSNTDPQSSEGPLPPSQSDDNIAQALQSAPLADNTTNSSRNPKWPLDKHPLHYSQQGERFSDILLMLLKMRSVPPKPQARSTDGMLVVWGEDADDKVREWYEGIGVSNELLAERSNARFVGDDPMEWELKYVGKIISGI